MSLLSYTKFIFRAIFVKISIVDREPPIAVYYTRINI